MELLPVFIPYVRFKTRACETMRDNETGLLGYFKGGKDFQAAPYSLPVHRQRTRLAEALLATPSRLDNYFERRPWRQWVWVAISFAAGVRAVTSLFVF